VNKRRAVALPSVPERSDTIDERHHRRAFERRASLSTAAPAAELTFDAADSSLLPPLGRRAGLGWKRAFDIVCVLVALPLIIPLFLVLAIGIVCSSPGNPLFRQRRVGRDGEIFKCLKFRTMYRDAEARLKADPELFQRYCDNDYKLPVGDDPRVFWLGRLLRRTSLDELPQLFNVLTGKMSLVGPRPVVPAELDLYGPWKFAYLEATPGLTGVWQVSGRNHIRYPERAKLDADYVLNWSFRNDLVILAKTVPTVLRRHGNH
jgi:lipopolysaccharide/colanic/teichoic acid biosynthesis glycosyltransferase